MKIFFTVVAVSYLIFIIIMLCLTIAEKSKKEDKKGYSLSDYNFRIAIETRADNEKVYFAQWSLDNEYWYGLSFFGETKDLQGSFFAPRRCKLDSYKDAERAISKFKHKFTQSVRYIAVN